MWNGSLDKPFAQYRGQGLPSTIGSGPFFARFRLRPAFSAQAAVHTDRVAIRMPRPKSHAIPRTIYDLTEADWNERIARRTIRILRILASPRARVALHNPRFVLPEPPRPDLRLGSCPWDQLYRTWRDEIYFIFYDCI